MIDYAAILSRKHAGREWKLEGDDYAGLTMLDGGDKPTKQSLDAAWPEVEAQILAEIESTKAAKTSVAQKLAALGLTEAEIKALVG